MSMKPNTIAIMRRRRSAFTLVELLVSVVVLVIIIFMVSQLMSSTAAVTRTGKKHIDTDTQARVVFDGMGLDLVQMLKRTYIDSSVKKNSWDNGHGQSNS